MATYTASELRVMKPTELRAVADELGLEVTGYGSLEDFIRAVLDTQVVVAEAPEWLREADRPATTRRLGGVLGRIATGIDWVDRLLNENELLVTALMTLFNTRYMTQSEVEAYLRRNGYVRAEQLAELADDLDKRFKALKTTDTADDVRAESGFTKFLNPKWWSGNLGTK